MVPRFSLLLATFLSGAAALIFEVVWVRLLTQVLGHTTAAVTAVLAAFFLGLGLGSFLASRIVERTRHPLRIYAGLEVLIAVLGVSMPALVGLTEGVFLSGEGGVSEGSLFPVIRFLLAVSVLLLPTLMMGATVPLLTHVLTRNRFELGDTSGLLYAVNTVGAVIGTLLAGFFLIETFGLLSSCQIAGILNVTSALLVLAASPFVLRRSESLYFDAPDPEGDGIEDVEHVHERAGKWVLIAIGLSGLFALSYEVLWTRLVGMFLVNSSYSFTLILATVLLGSAVGALFMSRFVDGLRRPAFLLGVSQVLLGTLAVTTLFLLQALNERMSMNLDGPIGKLVGSFVEEGSYGGTVASEALGICAFFLTPTLIMGMTFPLAVRLYGGAAYRGRLGGETGGHTAGRSVGSVLYANTLIGLFGPPLTTFLLIPWLGVANSLVLLGVLQALFGVVLILLTAEVTAPMRWVFATLVVAPGVFFLTLLPRDIQVWKSPNDTKLIAYREGSAATVAVVLDSGGLPRLKMNNTYSLGGGEGRLIEARQGHLPVLLAKSHLRNVLVIGMGTGNTARALSRHSIEELSVVEIVPGVIDLTSYFAPPGEEPLEQEKVKIIGGDGREVVLRSKKSYDLVVGDLFFPWRAGMSELYSQEHFERIKEKLALGGVYCQWLPLYQLSPDCLGIVVRTFLSVFPEATLWMGYPKANDPIACLVGGATETLVDPQALEVKLRDELVRSHLQAVGFREPVDVMSLFVTGPTKLKETYLDRLGQGEITTDDRPILEFRAAREHSRQREFGLANLRFLLELRSPPGPELVSPLGGELAERRDRVYRAMGKILEGHAHEMEGALDLRTNVAPAYAVMYMQRSIDAYCEALEIAPSHDFALIVLRAKADTAMNEGHLPEAISILEEVLGRIEPKADLLGRLGVAWYLEGDPGEALGPLNQCLALDARATLARIYLGKTYLALDRPDEAEQALMTAKNEMPAHPVLNAALGELYVSLGRIEEAKNALSLALQGNPRDSESRDLLQKITEKP